jgi:diaminohydroxyphosphoribosylaminopyrimidine deaminase/5-amino-6-(5-phosphoribosylamino)uracil reductase
VLADDPLLTVRLPGLEDRSPLRVVVDSTLRTPPTAIVIEGCKAVPTWIVTSEAASPDAERRLRDAGVEVLRVEAPGGRIDLRAALALLAARASLGSSAKAGQASPRR